MRYIYGPQAPGILVTELNVNPNILIFTENERHFRHLERMKPEVSTILTLAQQQASEPVNIREGSLILVSIQTTLGRLIRYSNRRWGTHLCDSYSLLKCWENGKISNGVNNSYECGSHGEEGGAVGIFLKAPNLGSSFRLCPTMWLWGG